MGVSQAVPQERGRGQSEQVPGSCVLPPLAAQPGGPRAFEAAAPHRPSVSRQKLPPRPAAPPGCLPPTLRQERSR